MQIQQNQKTLFHIYFPSLLEKNILARTIAHRGEKNIVLQFYKQFYGQ